MLDTTGTFSDLSRFRLLVIENDQDTLELLTVFLRHCGADVVTAQDAMDALGYLNGQRIDAILTDVSVLSEITAVQFTDEIRTRPQYKSIPVIAVTGWSKKDAVCRNGGFSAFMQKPVDLDHLAATIQKLAVTHSGSNP